MATAFRGEIWGRNGTSATNRAYLASSNSFASATTVDIDQAQPYFDFKHSDGSHSVSFVVDVNSAGLIQSHISGLSGNGPVNIDSGIIEIITVQGPVLHRVFAGSIYVTGSGNNKLRVMMQTIVSRP